MPKLICDSTRYVWCRAIRDKQSYNKPHIVVTASPALQVSASPLLVHYPHQVAIVPDGATIKALTDPEAMVLLFA